ncbi:MAG TPA: hypothetical protein VNG31_05740 [Candidatus Baltobacteraceae bacterium]|nr:hypothetical protein [Candidatus Baltobacteraceae bacterium]
MRTTLTLDEDVAAKIAAEVRRSGRPLKQVVNDALRTGLAAKGNLEQLPAFHITPEDTFRLKRGFDYDKPEGVFDQLEGPGRLR